MPSSGTSRRSTASRPTAVRQAGRPTAAGCPGGPASTSSASSRSRRATQRPMTGPASSRIQPRSACAGRHGSCRRTPRGPWAAAHAAGRRCCRRGPRSPAAPARRRRPLPGSRRVPVVVTAQLDDAPLGPVRLQAVPAAEVRTARPPVDLGGHDLHPAAAHRQYPGALTVDDHDPPVRAALHRREQRPDVRPPRENGPLRQQARPRRRGPVSRPDPAAPPGTATAPPPSARTRPSASPHLRSRTSQASSGALRQHAARACVPFFRLSPLASG